MAKGEISKLLTTGTFHGCGECNVTILPLGHVEGIGTRIGLLLRERLGNARAKSNDVRNAQANIGPVSPRLRSGLRDLHVGTTRRATANSIRFFGWLGVRIPLQVAVGFPILAFALILTRYQVNVIGTSFGIFRGRTGHLHDAFLRGWDDSPVRVMQVSTAGATVQRSTELGRPLHTISGIFAVVPTAVLHHEGLLDVKMGAGCVLERANELAAAFLIGVRRRLDHHRAAIVGLLDVDERGVGAIVFESAGRSQWI